VSVLALPDIGTPREQVRVLTSTAPTCIYNKNEKTFVKCSGGQVIAMYHEHNSYKRQCNNSIVNNNHERACLPDVGVLVRGARQDVRPIWAEACLDEEG